ISATQVPKRRGGMGRTRLFSLKAAGNSRITTASPERGADPKRCRTGRSGTKRKTGDTQMNIKSLLIGSAAALVMATGAQAADAIVMPEPEPMDYVRICDVYGTGFYYIPGTETCLKIGGYMRYEIYHGVDGAGLGTKRARFAPNFDVRS